MLLCPDYTFLLAQPSQIRLSQVADRTVADWITAPGENGSYLAISLTLLDERFDTLQVARRCDGAASPLVRQTPDPVGSLQCLIQRDVLIRCAGKPEDL